MKRLFFYKLKSHEDTLLLDHLRNVGNRAFTLIECKDINFKYSKRNICEVAKVMGYCHDLGKATSFFQQYLSDMIKCGKSDVKENLKSHALISALICIYNVKEINKELSIMTYLAIKRHHGNLKNLTDELQLDKLDIKLIETQYKALEDEVKYICKELSIKLPELDEFMDFIKEELQYDILDEYNDEVCENEDFERYILVRYLFSVLIYADKEDAIFNKEHNIIYDIPSTLIDEYKISRFGVGDKNNIRNIVYDEVLNSIKKSNDRIMSITLPTGTGKTYACMSVALKLKEKLNKDMKIIYCLPFTSVIDQNFNDYKNAIGTIMGEEKQTSDRILKHHYLSPKNYKNTDIYYDGDEGRFLTQNWNSQIVVTTFIQFFNAIFSNRNSDLIKYNTLSNSIILLDEVQSIPYKYWGIINNLFKKLAEELNIYFIFITATQPLIFSENEILELAPNKEIYFKNSKRTKLIINNDKMDKEDFFEYVRSIVENNKEKNILIIVNTIKLSQELYIYLKELKDIRELVYLSTSIIPKERKLRIDKIKDNFSKCIVVSTQMVEAGVDIDMDIVIRDIAPLDSINQSSGRANRENRGEYLGEVHLVKIVNNVGYLAQYVYRDNILLEATEKVLGVNELIYEDDYKDLSDAYFNQVNEKKSNKESNELKSLVNKLRFESINEKFKLIDDQNKIQLFIEIDENAKEIWNEYLQFKEIQDIKEKRRLLEKIKGEFYQYVISVFKDKCKDAEDYKINYISYEQLGSVYDKDFGYKAEEDKYIII